MDNFNMMQNMPEQHKEINTEQNKNLFNGPGLDPMHLNELMKEDSLQAMKRKAANKEKANQKNIKKNQTEKKVDNTGLNDPYMEFRYEGPMRVDTLEDKEVTRGIRIYNASLKKLDDTVEQFKARAGEKGANATTNELYLAMVDMKYVRDTFGKSTYGIDEEKAIDAILRLHTAADSYMLSHGRAITPAAYKRDRAAEALLKNSKDYLCKFTAAAEEEIKSEGAYSIDTSKGIKPLKEKMGLVVKALGKFYRDTKTASSAKSPDKIIEEKLNVYRIYDETIRLYRSHVKPGSWTSGAKKVIEEYETLLRAEMLIKYRNTLRERKENEKIRLNLEEEKKKQTYEGLIQEHLEKEDNKKNNIKLEPKNIDKGLTEAQLKGISDIDQWLVRNANNAGLAGNLPIIHFFKLLNNENGNFVKVLLSKSKRERLYMYYLVETDKRKDPSFLDIPMSQNVYVPTLEGFKNKMLATKFKVISHMTGAYTYMNKLSQASHINDKNKEQIKLISDLENGRYEKANTNGMSEEEKITQERINAYAEIYTKMAEFRKVLLKGADAKGIHKKPAEAEAKKLAAELKAEIKKHIENDASLKAKAALYLKEDDKELKKKMPKVSYSRANDIRDNVKTDSLALGMGANKGVTVLNTLTKDGATSAWNTANLWTGSFASSLAGISSMMSIVASIIALAKNSKNMSFDSIVEHSMNMAKGTLDIAKAGSTIVDLVNTGGNLTATISNTTKVLGGASAGVDMLMAGYEFTTAYTRELACNTAKAYFLAKHEKMPGDKREEKFENGMIKLSEDLILRKKTAGVYHTINATSTFISVTVPGIPGLIFAGVAGVGALAATIHDIRKMSNIQKAMFDVYYNLDELVTAVQKLKKEFCLNKDEYVEGDRETLKDDLRDQISSQASNSDMKGACDHIAAEYSEFVYNKLFGENKAKGQERDAYIEVVKMFNLTYNEEKNIPSQEALCVAMKGG